MVWVMENTIRFVILSIVCNLNMNKKGIGYTTIRESLIIPKRGGFKVPNLFFVTKLGSQIWLIISLQNSSYKG